MSTVNIVPPSEERTSNVIDVSGSGTADASAASPNAFFVLHSSTSLFAGVPHMSGKLDGQAESATFNTPSDIVVDKNQQLFIADTQNARIRRINKLGKVSTIASISGGDGPITNWPYGLAFDHSGALYILQSGEQHHIYQISPSGRVAQLAGSNEIGHRDFVGDLWKASFNYPRATGVDSKNRLYICEKGNNCVRRVDLTEKSVTTLLDAENKPLDLSAPEGVVVDQFDDIYVADTGNHRILKISPRMVDGVEVNIVTNYCGKYRESGYANGDSTQARLNRPTGLAIDKQNHLWICDSGNNCVRMLSYRSELLFTISGKGSASQEKLYHNPTSIALSYDAQYGAEMAMSTPEEVKKDPNHPLYFSYITPVVFVADSQAHCIKRIHTVLMEEANALIDICNNEPTEDFPMHNALAYGDSTKRDELMKVLLQLKPHLLEQKDGKQRFPIHVACLESRTEVAGSISLNDTIKRMIKLSANGTLSLNQTDADGKTPLFYALQQMALHAFNESTLGIKVTKETPSQASIYSRALITYLIQSNPNGVLHPSCLNYTLHWYIFQGFPLKVLKKVVQAYEDAQDPDSKVGASSASSSTAAPANPFMVRDQSGRLPLHVACMLQGEVGQDIIQWLTDNTHSGQESIKARDGSILAAALKQNPDVSLKEVGVPGHFPLFYACTTSLDSSATPSSPAVAHPPAPLYNIPPTQVAIIEHLLKLWPQAIMECEGAPITHGSELPSKVNLSNAKVVPASSLTSTFLEWVFYLKALELLRIFLRALPSAIDTLAWQDSQDAGAADKGLPPNMLSMLHCSASIGDAELVTLLLSCNANPFNRDTRAKIPLDYCSDTKCIQLLKDAMARDPRRPKTPEPPSEDESPEMCTVETQTTSGDSVLESARQKLANREAELKSEADRMAAEALAAQQQVELERLRLKDKEDALVRQTEADREMARQKSEAALLAKTLELAATQQRLAEELEAERARLRAREAEAIRAADAQLEASRQKMESELLAASEENFRKEQARLQAELEVERARLADKEKALLADSEKDRSEARMKLEADLTAASELKLATEQKRFQDELEVERLKLKEKELELARALEHEKDMARIRLEHEYASKNQALNSNSTRLSEQLELERAALKEREAELLRETEHERQVARMKLEHDLKVAADAALQVEQRRLAESMEAEHKRLRDREESMRAELETAKAAAKLALETELMSRADESTKLAHARLAAEFETAKRELAQREQQNLARLELEREDERMKAAALLEAERHRLEAAHHEKLRELERERIEQQQRFSQLEEQGRLARENAALESSKAFSVQLEVERERLAAAFHERAKNQDSIVERELKEARQQLEDQRGRWEENLRREREKLTIEFEERRIKLEQEEQLRLERVAAEDRERRTAFERDREARRQQEEAERSENNKRSAVDRETQRNADLDRAEKFATAERERASRWEAEEAQRRATSISDKARFDAERTALLQEIESTKKRLEDDHAARLALEAANVESLRLKYETEKEEYRRRMEIAFEAEKTRLKSLAHEDSLELMKKVEAERKRDTERLEAERRRMEVERSKELERADLERQKMENEREAEAIRARQANEAKDAAHRKALKEKEAQHEQKLKEHEATLKAAEEARLHEKALRIQALEEDIERTRRELELQIAEKHATRRGLQEKSLKVDHLEKQLDAMAKLKAAVPPIRYTSNPLDVDPSNLPHDELPGVANSIASFAKNFQSMTFKSLLALLLSIPHSQLSKATILLRLYLSTHPGCGKKVDEVSGLYPLHMSAQAGLYRELTDIILKENPLALKTEDRNGVYPIFYAVAFRKVREETKQAQITMNEEKQNVSSTNAIPIHDDFKPETVRRYNLELIKYFMLKFPDSIYLPNTLRPAPEVDAVTGVQVAPIDEFSTHSLSVVEYAIEEQDLDLLTLLFELTAGDFLNAIDSVGRTYLHRAASEGKVALVQWLVEVGKINPWTLCNADKTALEYVNAATHEELALYLTREMAKVAPEFRVKQRRGGKRLLIREWSSDPDSVASRFIGGRDSFLPSPVSAARGQLFVSTDEVDELLDSAFNSAANTPRTGALNPVRTLKSPSAFGREEYDLVSRPEGSPKNVRGSPVTPGGTTTHIHVYPPMNNSRSLPSLRTTPNYMSPTKTPKKKQQQEEEYNELERYAAATASNGTARTTTPLTAQSKAKRLHGYHWEFLDRPRTNHLILQASPASSPVAAAAASPARSPQRQLFPSQQQHYAATQNGLAAEAFVAADSVENTLYSLQATTSNLQQLLSDLNRTSPAAARTQRRR